MNTSVEVTFSQRLKNFQDLVVNGDIRAVIFVNKEEKNWGGAYVFGPRVVFDFVKGKASCAGLGHTVKNHNLSSLNWSMCLARYNYLYEPAENYGMTPGSGHVLLVKKKAD